jgi:hypothetical protein
VASLRLSTAVTARHLQIARQKAYLPVYHFPDMEANVAQSSNRTIQIIAALVIIAALAWWLWPRAEAPAPAEEPAAEATAEPAADATTEPAAEPAAEGETTEGQ